MKRYIFSILCVALCLTSCKWDGEPQVAPVMSNSYFIVFHPDSLHTKDTLGIRVVNNETLIDTIAVGDTVQYYVGLDAVAQQLTSFVVTTDTAGLNLSLLVTAEFRQALEATSDPEHGKLDFKPGYRAAALPVQYIAKRPGTPKVTMVLSSNSTLSPSQVTYFQPIK